MQIEVTVWLDCEPNDGRPITAAAAVGKALDESRETGMWYRVSGVLVRQAHVVGFRVREP